MHLTSLFIQPLNSTTAGHNYMVLIQLHALFSHLMKKIFPEMKKQTQSRIHEKNMRRKLKIWNKPKNFVKKRNFQNILGNKQQEQQQKSPPSSTPTTLCQFKQFRNYKLNLQTCRIWKTPCNWQVQLQTLLPMAFFVSTSALMPPTSRMLWWSLNRNPLSLSGPQKLKFYTSAVDK